MSLTNNQQAWLRQETELQQMKDKLENLQATQRNRPTTMMETPRAIRPQDVEYQSLLDTAKRLKEKNAEEAERPPYAYQNRHLNSLDDPFTPLGQEPNIDMALTMKTFLSNMGSVLKNHVSPVECSIDLFSEAMCFGRSVNGFCY